MAKPYKAERNDLTVMGKIQLNDHWIEKEMRNSRFDTAIEENKFLRLGLISFSKSQFNPAMVNLLQEVNKSVENSLTTIAKS